MSSRPADLLRLMVPSLTRRTLSTCFLGLVMACFALTVVPAAEDEGQALTDLETFDIGAVRAQTGGLLLSGQAGGSVEGELAWSAAGRDENDRVVMPFVVEVDGGTLLSNHAGRRIVIGIYAYVVDPDGRIVDHIAQGLVLDAAAYRDRIVATGLKFVGRFLLQPGDYTLRVMVENNATGDYYMSWSIITLPSADNPAPQLLPPLFPDPKTRWVVARQQGAESAVSVGLGDGFLPAARPTAVENQPAEIYLGGGGWDEAALVEIRILNQMGRTVSEPLVSFAGPPLGDFEFRRAVLTPIDLPPGNYSLVLTLTDENASEVLRRAMRMTVVSEGEQLGWAGVGKSPPVAGASAAVVEPKRMPKPRKKETRASYRRALGPLAEGDAVAARRMVAEFERRAAVGAPRANLLVVSEVELAVAKDLARANPSCLMPLALLHRDLYRGYTARREGALAAHARGLAITFADLLGRAKPYNGFSEGLMVNIAADLAQVGSFSAARGLLEGALRINRGFRPAMLSLGFSYEQTSDYLEASEVYEELVNTHPGFDEGRLRLGINLIRTGRTEAGEELLRELLATGARPWIEAIAAHETVRLQARKRKHLPEAERDARAALERLPDDQRLWILLASILERSDRHDEALQVLANLPPASRGVSPRARYADWPALGVRASQAHLNLMAAESLAALKAALANRGGAG